MNGPSQRPPLDRFMEKIAVSALDCWIWTDRTDRYGYGKFRLNAGPGLRREVIAHRFAYEAMVGPIPHGLTVDHLCRDTRCVNPAHLEPVTNAENIRRAVVARRGAA